MSATKLPVSKIQTCIQSLDSSDLHKSVVGVGGILLPRIEMEEVKVYCFIVHTQYTIHVHVLRIKHFKVLAYSGKQ